MEIGDGRVSGNSDNLVQDNIERTLTQIASGQRLTSSGTATKTVAEVKGVNPCARSLYIYYNIKQLIGNDDTQ